MRIVPVLDLMQGVVVRGVAGRRDEYRPIESRLCADAQPLTVMRALRDAFGLESFYVADLDAILGGEPSWDLYRRLLDDHIELWIDAGVATFERANALANFTHAGQRLSRVIVGLESLATPDDMSTFARVLGGDQAVFSLDLKQGRPLTNITAWNSLEPIAIAQQSIDAGFRRLIVLDLAGVGMSGGVPTLDLCRELRRLDDQLEIITGGGVRGADDIRAAVDAGCDALLVASALHDGRLTPAELR